MGWIKQRCSRGRTGQQGHGSGVCRSQISRINYCNVSYQFPAGLCQLCTKRGNAVKLCLKGSYRQMSSIWCKDINFYQYSFRLILLWKAKSLVFFSEILFFSVISFLSCGLPSRHRRDLLYFYSFTSCSSSTDLKTYLSIFQQQH